MIRFKLHNSLIYPGISGQEIPFLTGNPGKLLATMAGLLEKIPDAGPGRDHLSFLIDHLTITTGH